MSTGIAHEINNPLAIINESAGFMKEVIETPEMSAFSRKGDLLLGIEKIEKSVKRARRITHQLLGHVKKQDSAFSEVNLEMLTKETLDLLKKDIEDKEISVELKMESNAKLLWSDPYQIRQVLINLLSNAIHALSKKGTITILTTIPDKFSEIDGLNRLHKNGESSACLEWSEESFLSLEIRDNGIGIPKENLGKIFDPFFTTKSFDQGTGLGLFVVHKIISGLGGQIEVESTVGKGTSFFIKLPRHLENKT
ncbi:ATPase/histidine kinase/DNA gyrase B/HSP90 domain protein (fragment) [Desulfamplus magnetovallimortis]|uniref:histidine kinase n=2 Tax=Desulfamplus magnetovallimortis TaxID=1246637 RepID=A0A1W1HJI5_9BACT